MLSPLRNRFGIPGVISVIALVFAMFGGAYAATNNGGKATASAKTKKGPPGPRGKTGPAGPAGPAGAKGDAGGAGANGANGTNGTNGVSVTAKHLEPGEGPLGEECEEGGTELKSASGTEVLCNGEEGPQGIQGIQGIQGPPGPTETMLPVGKTETGVWSFRTINVAQAFVTFSFPLNLPSIPELHYVKLSEQGTPAAIAEGCPTEVLEIEPPKAEPKGGHSTFCVYEGSSEGELVNATGPFQVNTSVTGNFGFNLRFPLSAPASEARGGGSWAVAR